MRCLLHYLDAANQDEMPAKLNKDDKEWIEEAIKAALAPKTLPDRLKTWIKTWGVAGSMMAAGVAVTIFIATQLSGNSKFQGATEEHFKALDSQLGVIRGLIASNQPAKAENQQAVKDLLAETRKEKTLLTRPIVQQMGANFVAASEDMPAVWATAQELLSYRTLLNANLLAVGSANQIATTVVNPGVTTHYRIVNPPAGYSLPTMSVGGDVPSERSAQMRLIEDSPESLPRGKEVLLAEGGAITMDGAYMRNVVLRNVTIFYGGGPAVLDGVILVNCNFVLSNVRQARDFAEAVLSKDSVNFSS